MTKWRRLNGQELEKSLLTSVEDAIIKEQKEGHRLKVCIGTDSEVYGKKVEFASVIVFLREGKGAFMYISNMSEIKKMSLKERMIKEVARSIDIAYRLCGIFEKYNIELEVHADINSDPNFKSNVALKEAMGYILGMGFKFRAKPDAFASSSCADRFC